MGKPYFLVSTIFLFYCSFTTQAQDVKYADSLFTTSQFSKAESIYLNARKNSITNKDWNTLAYCNIRIADIIRINGGNRLAIKLLEENDSIITNYATDELLISKNLIAKAEAYYNLNELGIFKNLVDSSYTIKSKISGIDSSQLVEELIHFGRYNLSITNFEKMLSYAQRARGVIHSYASAG